MKRINWGVAIVIAFVCFISFILYFVLQLTFDKKHDYHMVENNYYKREMEFQHKIDEQEKTQSSGMDVKIERIQQKVILHFPEKIDKNLVSGQVKFYFPSNPKLDFELPLKVESHKMEVSSEAFSLKSLSVDITYQYQGNTYRTIFQDKPKYQSR